MALPRTARSELLPEYRHSHNRYANHDAAFDSIIAGRKSPVKGREDRVSRSEWEDWFRPDAGRADILKASTPILVHMENSYSDRVLCRMTTRPPSRFGDHIGYDGANLPLLPEYMARKIEATAVHQQRGAVRAEGTTPSTSMQFRQKKGGKDTRGAIRVISLCRVIFIYTSRESPCKPEWGEAS